MYLVVNLVHYKLYDIRLKFFCVDLLVSGVKRRIDMHLTIHSARKGGFLHQISMFFPACSPFLSLALSLSGGKTRKETEMEIFTWQAKLSWEPTPTN